MTSNLIQKELMKWVMSSTSEIVVPNYYLNRFECDILKISKAGQLYEYEIKISKADFKKDAEKAKLNWNYNNGSYSKSKTKHSEILEGKRCSRFYFVVPFGLIEPSEVPDGLGLIYAHKGWRENTLDFKIVKMSKHFKKTPVDIKFYQHIACNLCLKLINAKSKILRK